MSDLERSAEAVASGPDRLSVPGHRLDWNWTEPDHRSNVYLLGGSCRCGGFVMDTDSRQDLTWNYRYHLALLIVAERQALRQRMGLT